MVFFFPLLGWVAVLAAREKREERRSKEDGKARGLKGFKDGFLAEYGKVCVGKLMDVWIGEGCV